LQLAIPTNWEVSTGIVEPVMGVNGATSLLQKAVGGSTKDEVGG